MLAAQLSELGVVQQQPEAPPRNNRNSKPNQSQVNNNVPVSSSTANNSSSSTNQQSNILDPLVDSETDSEPEDNGRVRNDGTLLASDPPKPL